MRIKITKPGLYDGQGREIPIGSTFDLKDEPKDWTGRYEVISGSTDGKTAILNADMGEAEIGDTAFSAKTGENLRQPDQGASQAGGNQSAGSTGPVYTVKQKAAGWNVITKDGEPVTKSLRQSETDGFDAMSDEAKATFVEQNKPEA